MAALAAGCAGFGVLTLAVGFSNSPLVRLVQGLAVLVLGALIVIGVVVLSLVQARRLASPPTTSSNGSCGAPSELAAGRSTWSELYDQDDRRLRDAPGARGDEDFKALVRSAIDELPLEFHRALEHVAIVVSDGGAAVRVGRSAAAPTASTRATRSCRTTSTTAS